jgi:hypothetical protein
MRMLRISLSTLILSLGIGAATSIVSGCRSTNSGLSGAEQQANPIAQRDLMATGPRLRMSVFDPNNKANVDAYAKAFNTMQSTPEGKKIWEQLASTHQNFCPHGNWFFLPWHRVYLHHFERTIAEISGKADFALPYWDWDGKDRNRMPPATLEKTSLFWAKRAPLAADDKGKLNPNNVGAPAMSRIMGANNFIAFGSGRSRDIRGQASQGLLEAMPHNSTHVWVGGNNGDMASFMSPRDPIFWMHHANVDRIWTSWMRAQQALNLPIIPPDTSSFDTKAVWLDFSLKDGFMEPELVNGKHQLKPTDKAFLISETLDSVAMSGYDYDLMAKLPTVGANLLALDDSASRQAINVPSPYRPAFNIEMQLKLKQVSVLSTSNIVVFTLDINGSSGVSSDGKEMSGAELLKRAKEALANAQSSGSEASQPSMVLYADNVPIPKDPKTTSLEFYFNKTPQTKPKRVPAEYLGSFSYFGTDHVHGGGHAMTTTGVVFDLVKSISETDPRVNQSGNLFVTMFVDYRNESGEVITRDMPNDLKENLKKMTLRVEYTEN